KYNYHRHIENYFANSIIVKLTYDHLLDFRQALCDKELSNNTVNKVMILLKRILDIALRKGYMKKNPCTLLKKLPTPTKRMNFWTLEEFKKFRKLFHYDEYNYLIFFSLAFFTGMRSGELLALTWADISFSRKEIDVNKTLVKVDGKFLFTSPKTTAAKRTVSVNQKLMEDLAQWKQIQSEWLSKYFPLTREEQ